MQDSHNTFFSQFGQLFTSDPNFGQDAARLIVFTIASLLGMACHWYKRWYKKETNTSFFVYFFKEDVRSTVFAVIGTLVLVATAWVLGLIRTGSVFSLMFQGLLIGFTSNSIFNQDGSVKSLTDMARDALDGFSTDAKPADAAAVKVKNEDVAQPSADQPDKG